MDKDNKKLTIDDLFSNEELKNDEKEEKYSIDDLFGNAEPSDTYESSYEEVEEQENSVDVQEMEIPKKREELIDEEEGFSLEEEVEKEERKSSSKKRIAIVLIVVLIILFLSIFIAINIGKEKQKEHKNEKVHNHEVVKKISWGEMKWKIMKRMY